MRGLRLILSCAATIAVCSPAAAKSLGCQAFMDAFNGAAGEHRVDFARSLSVGGSGSGFDYYDASGRGDVDVSVVCRGDRFVRSEVRAPSDANARQGGRFQRLRTAALKAGAGMDAGRAAGTLRSLEAEAKDYLRASGEREDVVVAGKVERHLPGGVGLGMIETPNDLTFILVME